MKRYLFIILAVQLLGCAHLGYDSRIDYGDFSPALLVRKSWSALDHGDQKGVMAYTGRCIDLYAQAAQEVNGVDLGPYKEETIEYQLLNDVAQCVLVRAEAYFQNKEYESARENFALIIEYFDKSEVQERFPWKPAEFARQRISEIDRMQEGEKEWNEGR